MTQTAPLSPTPVALVRKHVRALGREAAGVQVRDEMFEQTLREDQAVNSAWVAFENGTGTIESLDAALRAWVDSWRAALA